MRQSVRHAHIPYYELLSRQQIDSGRGFYTGWHFKDIFSNSHIINLLRNLKLNGLAMHNMHFLCDVKSICQRPRHARGGGGASV